MSSSHYEFSQQLLALYNRDFTTQIMFTIFCHRHLPHFDSNFVSSHVKCNPFIISHFFASTPPSHCKAVVAINSCAHNMSMLQILHVLSLIASASLLPWVESRKSNLPHFLIFWRCLAVFSTFTFKIDHFDHFLLTSYKMPASYRLKKKKKVMCSQKELMIK